MTPVQAVQRLAMPELQHVELQKLAVRFIVSRHADGSRTIIDALDRAYAELVAAGEDVSLPE